MAVPHSNPTLHPRIKPDIELFGGPSVFILTALTGAGSAWVEEHVSVSDETIFAFGGIVVEWRYVDDIAMGAKRDGLEVKCERA